MNSNLYQINTRVWLGELSRAAGRPMTLADVSDDALDAWSRQGIDWIWLLSVWQTGLASRHVSRTQAGWLAEYRHTLVDLTEDDVQGSGFAITDYVVADNLGGPSALANFRARLASRGMRLMLDFVPNHTALDHRWVSEGRELFITGDETQLSRSPQNYVRVMLGDKPRILAHGRDPYFDGWPDTLQLDYSLPATIQCMQQTLEAIAGQCDGVRCDMAMLVLPEVFKRSWGRPALPFWCDAIKRIHRDYPDFCFLAEVYWDMEWQLQQIGFDYTYDKRLYDRLLATIHGQPVSALRLHLDADLNYQRHMTRFLENHDEQRAASVMAVEQHKAAALITYMTPCLRFFHEGQWEGRRVKVSPHLVRRPDEQRDGHLASFYDDLMRLLKQPVLRTGQWRKLDCVSAWDGNPSHQNFVVFLWENEASERMLIVVNFSPDRSQCYVRLPGSLPTGRDWVLTDHLSENRHLCRADSIATQGIYFDEPGWRAAVFEMNSP